MKRAVQRELETTLAKALLRGDFAEEDTIVVEVAEGGDGASGGLRLHKGVPAGGANGVAAGGGVKGLSG